MLYLDEQTEWYIPLGMENRTCKNSGKVRAKPKILNAASMIFQAVRNRRISNLGRVDMYAYENTFKCKINLKSFQIFSI